MPRCSEGKKPVHAVQRQQCDGADSERDVDGGEDEKDAGEICDRLPHRELHDGVDGDNACVDRAIAAVFGTNGAWRTPRGPRG